MKDKLCDLDQRLLEVLAKTLDPATSAYLASHVKESQELVSQHLAQLHPRVIRESSLIMNAAGRTYEVWAYSLPNRELTAQQIFGAKTCPSPAMLKMVE